MKNIKLNKSPIGTNHSSFPVNTKLSVLPFLFCLNMKINQILLLVISIVIQCTVIKFNSYKIDSASSYICIQFISIRYYTKMPKLPTLFITGKLDYPEKEQTNMKITHSVTSAQIPRPDVNRRFISVLASFVDNTISTAANLKAI